MTRVYLIGRDIILDIRLSFLYYLFQVRDLIKTMSFYLHFLFSRELYFVYLHFKLHRVRTHTWCQMVNSDYNTQIINSMCMLQILGSDHGTTTFETYIVSDGYLTSIRFLAPLFICSLIL